MGKVVHEGQCLRGRGGQGAFSTNLENDMIHITFRRIAEDQARILADGEYVGDLYRHADILNEGAVYYVIHLIEDRRGPIRVHDRSRLQEVAERMVADQPYW